MNLKSLVLRRFISFSMAFLAVLPAAAEMRVFTDRQGRKIEAEIVSVSGSKVTLKLANGRTSTIPIKILSKGDQFFVTVWGDLEKKGGGEKEESATAAIPENVTYRFKLEVDKERTKKGDKTRVDNGEARVEEWIYEVELENRSRVKLVGMEMSYRIYVDPKASSKLAFLEDAPKFYAGRVKVDPVEDGDKVTIKTGPAIIKELELDGDFVFTDGSRNRLDDDLEGVWIKLWHGDKKVGEFKSNNGTVKKAKWADDEPADPNAEPEREKE